MAINCGALPRDLIASELFGYEGGAFTGAKRQGNMGKFELANGGTLFLDEIGEMPLDLQATLLRAVEQKSITRLGSTKEIEVDVKIISATNANLRDLINEKRFREDLYYRLSTLRLTLPPLRQRGEDIILLAEEFIRAASQRIGRQDLMTISPQARELLLHHSWHGNVRELQNLIEGIVLLYPDPVITAEHILADLHVREDLLPQPAVSSGHGRKAELTRERLLETLAQCGGNRSEAAKLLDISRRTLYRYLERWGIDL